MGLISGLQLAPLVWGESSYRIVKPTDLTTSTCVLVRMGSSLDAPFRRRASSGAKLTTVGGMSGVGRVFVSHASADLAWAEWVAWQLQDAGYEVELAVWHWGPGTTSSRTWTRLWPLDRWWRCSLPRTSSLSDGPPRSGRPGSRVERG
ncbi:hypothetical protein DC008_09550 [Streptomyces nigra]|nr:hypothetical protein DC008_09550 [Streptomyces nigra]